MSSPNRSNPPATPEAEPFYVNYLPVPAPLRRFAWRWSIALVLLAGATALIVSAQQEDPGTAVWNLDNVVELEGTLIERPYPMLLRERSDGSHETILLLGEGKHGVADRVKDMNGKTVRLRGTTLAREGRRLFELVSTDDALTVVQAEARATSLSMSPSAAPTHPTSLKGEIIDPKCYFGAMKPGHGKAHRACAALCLRGGIPPMFVSWSDDGIRTYHLLTQADGGPAEGRILEYLIDHVSEPIELQGWPEQAGDLLVFRIDTSALP